MKFKIIFSENAKEDLMNISRYISDILLEPIIAEKLSKRILKAARSLEIFPLRHRLCTYKLWKNKGIRVLPIENYLIFYLPDEIEHTVKIYRIFYGKMNIENQINKNI